MKQSNGDSKFLGFLLVMAIAAAFVLGAWWLLWQLWMYVLPQFWPEAPHGLARPSYWAFAAMWVLLGVVGTRLFGRRR